MSGSPTLLARTAFNTRSSLQVATNGSALKSARKHFPKDAAWSTREKGAASLTEPERLQQQSSVEVGAHPQQRLLGLGVILISCSPHTLFDGLLQRALLLQLPQVLVSLLTRFLCRQRSAVEGQVLPVAQRSRLVLTSYSLWASSSSAPGAMEAILKIS